MVKNSLPEYQKIADEILRRIHKGKYPANSYLPSENQLAREFGVTRLTVRRALNVLKNQGTIESFQGKGYLVRSLYWEQSLLQFYSFGRNIASKIEQSETRIISYTENAGIENTGIENINDVEEFAERKIWEIVRLRLINEIPLILETSYIPLEYMPDLNPEILQVNSLYDIMEENEIRIIRAKEFLEPVIPSDEARKLLELAGNTPLFKTTRLTYDSRSRLVEVREGLIRGDHFRFSTEMTL